MLTALPIVEQIESTQSVEIARKFLLEGTIDMLLLSSDIDGAEARDVIADGPLGLRVIMLLRVGDPRTLGAAAGVPAHGFVLESDLTSAKLSHAITEVVAGRTLVPAPLADYLLALARPAGTAGRTPVLTPRERQVLALLSNGLSNKEIAQGLGVSIHGAKRHVGNLLAKLNVPNRTLAVSKALTNGLLDSTRSR